MQRDILVTLWVLFDDLMDDDPKPPVPVSSATPEVGADESASPTANPSSKRHDP